MTTGVLSRAAAPAENVARAVPRTLQRACACGGAAGPAGKCTGCETQERLGRSSLQAKLTVSSPNDPYEHEADRVADQIMGGGMPDVPPRISPLVQRASSSESSRDDEEVHAKTNAAGASTPGAEFTAQLGKAGSGIPLPAASRDFFEAGFGRDLGHVRIHDGAEAGVMARAIEARAFTHGANMYFAPKEYDPASSAGRWLIAHELTHVFQQSDRAAPDATLQRSLVVQDAAVSTSDSGTDTDDASASASLRQVRPAEPAHVTGITMSCTDMRMRLATAAANYYYALTECSLPTGAYDTTVTVTGNDFHLNFGDSVSSDDEFDFAYRVQPGQTNPAEMLQEQSTVHVDVVEDLPAPRPLEQPEAVGTPECMMRLDDQILVPAGSASQDLFPTITVPDTTIWAHQIPLGQFGWVEVEASVSADVSGRLAGSYGPGRLTDICLTRLVDTTASSAPIDHPLLGAGSRADVSTYGLGGRARFTLPARAAVTLRASGRLKIAGEYLSVINLAEADVELAATGTASLAGSIDGAVEILAKATRSRATLEDNLLPLAVVIERSSIDGVDLAAEIGLRGRAAVSFSADVNAGFSLLGFNLWQQSWNLASFSTGIGWSGGLRYSPNPGIHWDLGSFGAMDEAELGSSEDETLDDVAPHEDAAEIDADDVLRELLDEDHATVAMPDGLTEDTALPFDWRKPTELYPGVLAIPLAAEPHELHRDDGPTTVRYLDRGRSQYVDLGVAEWPTVGQTFDYLPYTTGERDTPVQGQFNRLLDRFGASRAGLDAEHVWDVKLRGLEWDRFDNLWPASNQDQQLAGTQHAQQIRNYERTLGNVAGRYFQIVRVRHPAL